MTNEKAHPVAAKANLDRLTASFFRAVSFEQGEQPPYGELYNLFIEPREKLVNSGELTSFKEIELAEITEIFGNVAHRFSTYEKSGTMNGTPFSARGIISTQFIVTPGGWKISAMAWDDERPGLTIPDRYAPAKPSA